METLGNDSLNLVIGAEQDAGRLACLPARVDHAGAGGLHIGMVKLLDDAHAHAQVQRPDEEHIDSIDRRDFVRAGYGFSRFDLGEQQDLLVGFAEVLVEPGAEAAGAIHRRHAPDAVWRITDGGQGPPGLICGVNPRHHDPRGA